MASTRAAKPSETPLINLRRHFPTLSKKTHFISHSLGAMPQKAVDALEEFTRRWAGESIEAWHEWLPMVSKAGDEIGALIGAPPGTVTMHQNVSTWMGIIASCLDFPSTRNRVLSTDMNFPSVHYVWKEHERLGAKLDLVTSDDRITIDTQKFIEAIDERTAVVIIELVLFRSGYLQDAKAIIRAAHEKGALAVVDAYQAVGTVPVDVVDLGADFFTGGSVKWLCGGPGAAYCYIRKDLLTKFEPRLCGWFSHEEPFAFELDRIRYRKDAMRYMGGTPSVPALYSSAPGREHVRKIGVDRIRAKSKRQVAMLVELADDLGLKVNTPRDPERRGGMVCVDFRGSERVHDALLRRDFLVDWRPGSGIRISPHFYTSDDEVRGIMDEIRKLRFRAGAP
ncbi:MAG TPA: aminotransferase class V-fold PLP-dependent enzyme [Planctomycetota bacterium]|nr:aminotransferase class V-fold PLP-dependent enzyme [Planctomycetota bacterium]